MPGARRGLGVIATIYADSDARGQPSATCSHSSGSRASRVTMSNTTSPGAFREPLHVLYNFSWFAGFFIAGGDCNGGCPRARLGVNAVDCRRVTPEALHWLFWDVDPSAIDLVRHRDYVLERVMVRGDWQAICWL